MGILRLYLAVCVYLWHCWIVDKHYVLHSFSAVYCFFLISGFLISMALSSRSYPDTIDGTLRFYTNRALRLFPTYLVVLTATAVAYALGLVSFGVPGLNSFAPLSLADQVTVLPHVLWRNLTLDTDALKNTLSIGWYYTVGLEMMFYLIAPFFVRWRLPNLILLFVASGVVHFVPYFLGLPFRRWQYEFFPSTFVFFVAGSLAYRLYLAIRNSANRYAGWCLPIGVAVYGIYFSRPVYTDSFEPIALYAAFALMLPFLFIAAENRYIKTADRFLGDLSYPFYVVHGLAASLVGGGVGVPTDVVSGLVLAIGLSMALHFLVERPIESIRTRFKRSSNEATTAHAEHAGRQTQVAY